MFGCLFVRLVWHVSWLLVWLLVVVCVVVCLSAFVRVFVYVFLWESVCVFVPLVVWYVAVSRVRLCV